MRTKQRKPVVRSLISVAAVAASMLVLSPAPAQAADVCTGHSQPGLTITVAGRPVRIPAIDVSVCRDIGLGTITPTPRIHTSGYPCETSCIAIVLDWGYSSADQDVTVSYSIDGSGTSQTVDIPIRNASDLCLFGAGFPSPPVSGCLISVDPDGE